MAGKGGKRPGAGRPPGQPNKKTREVIEAIKAEGITPLEYMLKVLRDESQEPAVRLDAANKAAPYVHAKLSSVELTGKDGKDLNPPTVVFERDPGKAD